MSRLTYALITPVRDDEENLARLASCVTEQRRLPQKWVIVDNGSIDGSTELAASLAERHDWIEVATSHPTANAEPGAPIVRAFHAGLERIHGKPDVVVKLDADVSFAPDYFEGLLECFDNEPRLGIVSGECLELRGGDWKPVYVTEGHARGATRAYRRQCLDDLLPLPERMGWDTVDELKANVRGWNTGIASGSAFYHHRAVGERDGLPWARWVRQGTACHYVGYRFPYLVLRTARRSLRNPAAVGMIVGYLSAASRRREKLDDPAVLEHLRRRQSFRRLHLRVRETLGRI